MLSGKPLSARPPAFRRDFAERDLGGKKRYSRRIKRKRRSIHLPRLDWSRASPRPLIIPNVMTLKTLADRRALTAPFHAAVVGASQNVRSSPDSDRFAEIPKASLWANSGHRSNLETGGKQVPSTRKALEFM
jgi:hypothetical protein